MPTPPYFVGLDVGGTTMKAAVVDDSGTPLSKPAVTDTNPERGQDAGLSTMAETIRAAVAAAGLTMDAIAAVGVATPGLMDLRAGLILDPPNLKPWRNVPVRQSIQDAFRKPTAFQNDANAAAYGEYWVGAGREAESFVMFTLGTGVGGGIVIGDTIVEGRHSHGGELGHMRIESPAAGRFCGCGARGCLEQYASATAVVTRTREEMAAHRMPTRLRGIAADRGEDFSAKDIFDAWVAGDPLARKVVEDTAYYLALGCCAVIATVDPEMIVIGGGMAQSGPAFLTLVEENTRRFGLRHPASHVTIRGATLGKDAGVIGAAGCGRKLVRG